MTVPTIPTASAAFNQEKNPFPEQNIAMLDDGGLVFIRAQNGKHELHIAWFNDCSLPGESPVILYQSGDDGTKELTADTVHSFTLGETEYFTVIATVGAGKPVIGWNFS